MGLKTVFVILGILIAGWIAWCLFRSVFGSPLGTGSRSAPATSPLQTGGAGEFPSSGATSPAWGGSNTGIRLGDATRARLANLRARQ